MTDRTFGLGANTIEELKRIEEASARFSAAWKTGASPRIEDYLVSEDEAIRIPLLSRLLEVELDHLEQQGALLGLSEYQSRFPDALGLLRGFFPDPEVSSMSSGELRTFESTAERYYSHESVKTARPDSTQRASSRFGHYLLLGKLGDGSQGVVYRATDLRLNRVVALKTLRAGALATESERARFQIDANALASLDHPLVVPIFDVGDVAGMPYFTMRLIDGDSLSDRIDQYKGDFQRIGRLLATIARTVHEVHGRGILHRDLKPSNILLDRSGTPHVADFGLALRPESDQQFDRTGVIVGTASYMSPEQAQGKVRDLTPATDLYSLGAILYELLTGQPPFRAKTTMETVVLVLERDPVPPRQLWSEIPRDLEQICLKCLEKDPSERYPSTEALADDLDRFGQGEVVDAQRLSPWSRIRRWYRREPKLAFGLFGLAGIQSLVCLHLLTGQDQDHNWSVPILLVFWAVLKFAFQHLSRFKRLGRYIPPAWIITDMILYTIALYLVDGVTSSLVVGFPLLIALAGFWARADLVWIATGFAIAGYSGLQFVCTTDGSSNHFPDIVIAAMLIIGISVAHQVKRLRSLIQFYGQ